jgi:hypothetical protein
MCVAWVALNGCALYVDGDDDDGGDGNNGGPTAPVISASNGVSSMPGIPLGSVTVLDGATCSIDGGRGRIECDGVDLRPEGAEGVSGGIGWHVIEPVAQSCEASDARAPSIAVFSFGSLVVADNTTVFLRGPHALALAASDTIEIHGRMTPTRFVMGDDWLIGGYPSSGADYETLGQSFGPAPGQDVPCTYGGLGAGGAGGATAGARGGNIGGVPGDAIVPPFAPICGGSGGGSIREENLICGLGGGWGGPAVILAAGQQIAFAGDDFGEPDCGLFADGGVGERTHVGGAGGGAGGTISIEAPSIVLDPACPVTAIGGRGQDGAPGADGSAGGVGGAGGDGMNTPFAGGDAENGGGGGGAAGFIRLVTARCPADLGATRPPATCEPGT